MARMVISANRALISTIATGMLLSATFVVTLATADPVILSRNVRHISAADNTATSGQDVDRMREILMNSKDKIIDFERNRQMDADDASVRHLAVGLAPNETLQGYIQRNCTSCLAREEAKFARIERIKEDLLNKLGLRQPPNATAKDLPTILPHLQGLLNKWGFQADEMQGDQPMMYNNRIDLQPEDYDAKTEKIYAFASEPPLNIRSGTKQIAYFRFSPETLSNKVRDAKLHFYIKRPANIMSDPSAELVVRLYRVDNENGNMTEIDRKWFKKESFHANGHWDKFHTSMATLTKLWFTKNEKNFGLYVEMMYKNENLVVLPKDGENGKHMMYLEIETEDGAKSKRHKRDAPKLDCQERDNETRCCRYPLVIDFESFGWDWVIAPKKYLAYYCSGECPFRHLQRYLHTHLVQQANPKGNVGPCCYPTQMAPILMVYFNENKEVLVTKVPGMVVTRCGCA